MCVFMVKKNKILHKISLLFKNSFELQAVKVKIIVYAKCQLAECELCAKLNSAALKF